ncbi:MAG: allantoinase AllB [Actinomycetaceae bacterium]|nr:allantoinase AllB [Actinomycetaceae bacterium]
MSGKRTVLRSRYVVQSDIIKAASVVVEGEKIVDIADYDALVDNAEVINIDEDKYLLPGMIDAHVHINEPGRTQWEGFETATRAGAVGGFTTIIDMPLNSLPPTTTVAHLEEKKKAALQKIYTDIGFWGGAVPGNCPDMAALWQEGVFGFKCFLAESGVDEFQFLNSSCLLAHMEKIKEFDGLLIVHAEDAKILADAPPAGTSYDSFLQSRPHEAEDKAIADLIEAVRKTGCKTHILHLSSSWSIDQIRQAKEEGLPLTVETCPHYLTFSAESIPDGRTEFKCCPPLRQEENREKLWQALLEGVIDYVASDHSPCTIDLKRLDEGNFATAWGGIASVQLGLSTVFTGMTARDQGIEKTVDVLCHKPAQVLGIDGKGGIKVGNDADFCVFDPNGTFTVDVNALHHKNKISPYNKMTLKGTVHETYLRGQKVDVDNPHGQFLTRS